MLLTISKAIKRELKKNTKLFVERNNLHAKVHFHFNTKRINY